MSVWKTQLPLYYHSIAMTKHSPHLKILSKSLTKLRENGQMNIIFSRHFLDFPNCTPLLNEAKALGIKKLTMLFVVLLFSFALTLIILILETIYPRSSLITKNKVLKDGDVNINNVLEELEDLAAVKEAIKYLRTKFRDSSITLEEALGGLSLNDSIQKLLD